MDISHNVHNIFHLDAHSLHILLPVHIRTQNSLLKIENYKQGVHGFIQLG